MSGYGKYPKIQNEKGEWVEQRAFPSTSFVGDKGFTVQSQREDADINKIIARYERASGEVRLNSREPFYGDVSEFGDLAESIRKVNDAQELFMGYNADLRERFENSPVRFIEFLENPANREEAIALGIVKPPVVDSPPPPASPPVA